MGIKEVKKDEKQQGSVLKAVIKNHYIIPRAI